MGTNCTFPFTVIFIYAQKGLLSNKTREASTLPHLLPLLSFMITNAKDLFMTHFGCEIDNQTR
jgi:hypothetical protein